MTCIVGVEHDGAVWMGGDSAVSGGGSGDDTVHVLAHRKVVERGGMLLGLAGHLGACTYAALVPAPDGFVCGDVRSYVAEVVLPPIRARLKDADLGGEPCDLLVGVGGRLLYACTDGSVHGYACGYGAIGSGSSVALGALYALTRVAPEERLQLALAAAGTHCASVAPPYYVLRGG